MSFYTIDDAVPDLSQLSLSKRQLLSDYIMPEQGVPAFFRETLRPFVHLLLRAATRNFSHVHFLPCYSKSERYLLCSWIEILLWHFRLVVRSVSHRAASLARGELTWATTDFHIPGEAFHMLRISAYLCQFVGYTTGRDFVVSLRPDILIPLLEAAGSDIHWAGAKGEYPEHDPYESLCYADLLLHPDSTRALLNVNGSGGSPLSGLIEPLFPPRNYSGALPPPIVPIPNDELDRIESELSDLTEILSDQEETEDTFPYSTDSPTEPSSLTLSSEPLQDRLSTDQEPQPQIPHIPRIMAPKTLPMRGSKSAPSFDGKPGHLLRYLRDVQETGEDTERTTDDELIDIALRYLNIDDEELWKRKRTAIMTFDQFKKEIMKLYPGSNGDKLYAWSDLREVVRKGQEKPPSNEDDFGEYQRNFTRIADFLNGQDLGDGKR
ncbi:hypothetical protein C8R47DRAFT_1220840 [Mycena vitilis]|nr:hypothetical protein C8R47DRAFT_1220840 [Mycena vitilis]